MTLTSIASFVGVALALMLGQSLVQSPRDLVNHRVTAQVIGIIDGDTVDVLIQPSRRVRVRLHGADTPERDEPFYQQAVVFTQFACAVNGPQALA